VKNNIVENVTECKISCRLTELQMPDIHCKSRSEIIIFFCMTAEPDGLFLFDLKISESIQYIIKNIIDVPVSK
jgi:hypothetical protein